MTGFSSGSAFPFQTVSQWVPADDRRRPSKVQPLSLSEIEEGAGGKVYPLNRRLICAADTPSAQEGGSLQVNSIYTQLTDRGMAGPLAGLFARSVDIRAGAQFFFVSHYPSRHSQGIYLPPDERVSTRRLYAEQMGLADTDIERLPAHDDSTAYCQIEGIQRMLLSRPLRGRVETYHAQLATLEHVRNEYLFERNGPMAAWEAIMSMQVLSAFFSPQANDYSGALSYFIPALKANPQRVGYALQELRLRALKEAVQEPCPASGAQFRQALYQQPWTADDRNDPDMIFGEPTGIYAYLYNNLVNLSDDFSAYRAQPDECYGGFHGPSPSLRLLQAAGRVFVRGELEPNSDTHKVAALVQAAGRAFAPQAMI